MRKIVVGAVAALALAGCGSASKTTTAAAAPKPAAKPVPSRTAAPTTPAPVAHVGSTLTVLSDNEKLTVQLATIIDPATGGIVDADAGKRLIATKLVITNTGTAAVNDDADADVAVIGSDNQTYTPDDNEISSCTNFNSGQFTLTPGSSATGCVVFQLPVGVNVAKVQFSADFGGMTGEWVVSAPKATPTTSGMDAIRAQAVKIAAQAGCPNAAITLDTNGPASENFVCNPADAPSNAVFAVYASSADRVKDLATIPIPTDTKLIQGTNWVAGTDVGSAAYWTSKLAPLGIITPQ